MIASLIALQDTIFRCFCLLFQKFLLYLQSLTDNLQYDRWLNKLTYYAQRVRLGKHLPTLHRMLCPHRIYSSCQEEGASKNCCGINLPALGLWLIDTTIETKIICEKWIFRKNLILSILTKNGQNRMLYFLRKWRKVQKNLRHLRKMSNFVAVKPSKIGSDFRKSPFDGIDRLTFANFLEFAYYWILDSCIGRAFQTSGFAMKKYRHLRKIEQEERK